MKMVAVESLIGITHIQEKLIWKGEGSHGIMARRICLVHGIKLIMHEISHFKGYVVTMMMVTGRNLSYIEATSLPSCVMILQKGDARGVHHADIFIKKLPPVVDGA